MSALFLTTILTCKQITTIVNRLINTNLLTTRQKTEIILELQKSVQSCPIIIKDNDN